MNPSRSFSTAKHVCTVFYFGTAFILVKCGIVNHYETDKADVYMYRDLWRCLPIFRYYPKAIIYYSLLNKLLVHFPFPNTLSVLCTHVP